MVAFFYHCAMAAACKLRSVRRVLVACCLVSLCALAASCYSLDDDADENAVADRREAQAYIVTSYNKMAGNIIRSDFAALDRFDAVASEYQWNDKEASIERAKSYASMLLKGNVRVLKDVLSFCERNAGVYEADGNKVFHKVADAERRLALSFSEDVSVAFAWDMVESGADRIVVDLSLSFNHYRLAGQSRIYSDSVVSSYRMTRDDVAQLRIERVVNGSHILDALNGDGSVEMKMLSSDLRLQMMDMMCLHEKNNDVSTIADYIRENYLLQVENPRAFLDGLKERLNNLSRIVLTRPDGTVLCRVTYDMWPYGGEERLSPVLHWGDGSQQALSEFASASANEAFAEDAERIERLWRRLYELYGMENGGE